jgi:hypothetical protein
LTGALDTDVWGPQSAQDLGVHQAAYKDVVGHELVTGIPLGALRGSLQLAAGEPVRGEAANQW